jgi:hypothetical protein
MPTGSNTSSADEVYNPHSRSALLYRIDVQSRALPKSTPIEQLLFEGKWRANGTVPEDTESI